MKRISIIIISLLVGFAVYSQHISKPADQAFLIWASGNANVNFDQLDWTKPKIGEGGMIGAGYQWSKNYFAINTGLEFSFQHRILGVSNAELSQAMLDTEGMPFIYNGHIKDRTDVMNVLDLNIPILVGAKGNVGYILAGLKLGINSYTWTKQTGYYSTEGLYDRFYDPLVNMPNHGFHDYEAATTHNKGWLGLNLKASLEFGAIIPTKNEHLKVRLGLFADYAFYEYNVRPTHIAGPALESSWNQYLQLTLNHTYLSNEGVKTALNNVETGLKVTFQWQYKHNYPCVICYWSHWRKN